MIELSRDTVVVFDGKGDIAPHTVAVLTRLLPAVRLKFKDVIVRAPACPFLQYRDGDCGIVVLAAAALAVPRQTPDFRDCDVLRVRAECN